jgi:hypothetical protein
MNTLLNTLHQTLNKTTTENGAVTLKSSLKHTVDFFGLGGALRSQEVNSVISIFSKAFAEDALVAVKTLFYLRDIRGGQGERKTFRTCFKWLANSYPQIAINNLKNVVEYGRWDDLFCLRDTGLWNSNVLPLIRDEWLKKDLTLFWKWMPSINTSSKETCAIAESIRKYLGLTHRVYRKTLSSKRTELKIVERDMCSKNWQNITYKSVPSRASILYKDAFIRHDSERYSKFISDVKEGKTTINASVLYPYDIVEKCLSYDESSTLDVLWEALPDYTNGSNENSIVVADVSGSMSGRPMAVSISLAMYIAERNKGAFKNNFITFSSEPSIEKVIGNNIREKVTNLSQANWGMSTNLEKVFTVILDSAKKANVPADEMPSKVYIVSDMEFNVACNNPSDTLFQNIEAAYANAGYIKPELVFWNVNARNVQSPITFNEKGACLVSGCSPAILTSLLSGEIINSEDLMLKTINNERYNRVII